MVAGAALLHRQARLGAVERLDLALLVDRQHDGVGRRIDVEADDVAELLDERRVVRQLEAAPAVRREAVRLPDALHRRRPRCRRPSPSRAAVQWVASYGGGCQRQRDDLGDRSGGSGALPRRPRLVAQQTRRRPRRMKRSCQRQTQVFDLPVSAMIADGAETVGAQQHDPRPPDVLLRALAIRDDRLQVAGGRADETVKDIPVRMRQTRTHCDNRESQIGLFCSGQSTRRCVV